MAASFKQWFIRWWPPLLWMTLIFIGSSIPGGEADTLTREASGVEEPVQIQRIKDVVHVVEYGILAVLLTRGYTGRKKMLSYRHMFQSFVIAALYGISDELHQFFVPFRFPGMDDVIRNTVGAGLGVLIVMGRYWMKSRRIDHNERMDE